MSTRPEPSPAPRIAAARTRRASPKDRAQARRLAPPQERAKAREVARFVMALDEPSNMTVALTLVCAVFPGIKLRTALAGYVFRTLLAKPERALQ